MKEWWELPGWRDQQKAKEERMIKLGSVFPVDTTPCSYFNPNCKHEACSYDILTCPECIKYTKEKLALEREKDNGIRETKAT